MMEDRKQFWPVRIPVIEPLDHRRCNVFEHTPLDYYRYGEFPRFIRLVGAHGSPMEKTVWVSAPTHEEATTSVLESKDE